MPKMCNDTSYNCTTECWSADDSSQTPDTYLNYLYLIHWQQ